MVFVAVFILSAGAAMIIRARYHRWPPTGPHWDSTASLTPRDGDDEFLPGPDAAERVTAWRRHREAGRRPVWRV